MPEYLMRKSTFALCVALVITNAVWLYAFVDAGVSYGDVEPARQEDGVGHDPIGESASNGADSPDRL